MTDIFCLATHWFDDDPMPYVCARSRHHRGPHETKAKDYKAGVVEASRWPNEDEGGAGEVAHLPRETREVLGGMR